MGKPFEIGLAMAGAVSAGAYTAGVLDFLVEALDNWEAAKQAGLDVPGHGVRLKVLAGTSAGGMTAAMAAGALTAEWPTVINPAQASPDNTLFESWVRRIDIMQLLGARDLQQSTAPLRSLLDSTVLDEIACDALRPRTARKRRAYLAEPLHIVLTTTNLNGVPYNIGFKRGEVRAGHHMTAHADWVHFALCDDEQACPADALPLDPAQSRHARHWALLETAALATGAFPVGLAPRTLTYPRALYEARLWDVPGGGQTDGDGCTRRWRRQAIAPNWPETSEPVYRSVCVDGGVMNNEPFDLARRVLLDGDCANPRAADTAHRALIMIDPFPDETPETAAEIGEDLLSVLPQLFTAMKNQTRFKPEDLVLAQDGEVYSRFLIAPSRHGVPHPLACGALGGFSGFLSQAFREHDFMLGRRNCWSFLKDHFRLAESNPVFDDWVSGRDAHATLRDGVRFLPVIPLVGSAAVPPVVPDYPRYSEAELATLCRAAGKRFEAVTRRLTGRLAGDKWVAKLALNIFARRRRDDFTTWLDKTLRKKLTEHGLMP